ncbi:MAG: hypothetical protein KIG60_01235 [Caryophanon sp.]|nr:hypothetical protein [Caryophanon sp.]
MFGDLFKNSYAQTFGGANAVVDPAAWNDLQAANFMNFGTEPGTYPGFGEQLKFAGDELGNKFAQNQGLLNFGLAGAKGIFDTYNMFKQNSMQKDLLNFQKDKYRTDLGLAKKATNLDLYERQRRRVSANPNAESVESYMKKWGV